MQSNKGRPSQTAGSPDTQTASPTEVKANVEVALNYMEKQANFMRRFHTVTVFLMLIASGGLFATLTNILALNVQWVSIFAFIACILGLIDTIKDCSGRAYEYKLVGYKMNILLDRINQKTDSVENIEAEYRRILVDFNFDWLKVLYMETANEVNGGPYYYKIPFWASLFKHIWSVPLKPRIVSM